MPDPEKIIERIRANGANVTLNGGRLEIINVAKLPAGAREYIKQHGKAIAAYLDREAAFEERAAIMQYDGGLTRPVAEYMAKLLQSNPPEAVDPSDWSFFVGKAAEVVDRQLARAA